MKPLARRICFVLPAVVLALSAMGEAQLAPSHTKPSPGIQAQNQTRNQARNQARNIEIHFDPGSTQIHFKLGSVMRDIRGTFQFKGGALAIDPDSTLAQGELLVDATTGHTGSDSHDKELQEVLESSRYPSIFFHAEHLRGEVPKKDGSSDVIAEGTLNIHGADHPIQMKVHLVRAGNSLSASTRFTVPYVEWGMKNPRGEFFHYSKSVQVDVSAKGTVRTVAVINSGVQSNDSDEEKPH
jgi:polyisoprenoid-binding protein YceI